MMHHASALSDTVCMVHDDLKTNIFEFVTSGKNKVAMHLMNFLCKKDANVMEICLKVHITVYNSQCKCCTPLLTHTHTVILDYMRELRKSRNLKRSMKP